MRVLLTLLMLMLLPFSAAAVEMCGSHAAGQGPQAVHHQSAHGVPAGDGFDADGGTCHAHCVAVVTASGVPLVDPAGTERNSEVGARLWPPRHERPDRPQWPAPTRSGWPAFA